MQPTQQTQQAPPAQPTAPKKGPGTAWTRALGAASVALGLPAVTLAGPVCRIAGLVDDAGERTLVRAVGARELLVAGGLLAKPHRGWLWARVAGDAVDLTLLGRALAGRPPARTRTLAITGTVVAITVLDLVAALTSEPAGRPVEARATVTVNRPRHDVYELWRRMDNLPRFMAHVDDVQVVDERRSHWSASAPFGRTVEWDAEIVEEVPGERLVWRSLEAADVANEGTVLFTDAPGERGTEVHVTLRYQPPAGDLGQAMARYFGEEPHQQLDDDLRRLKQVLEAGEVVRSDGAPWGKRSRREFPQHAARPLSAQEISEGGSR